MRHNDKVSARQLRRCSCETSPGLRENKAAEPHFTPRPPDGVIRDAALQRREGRAAARVLMRMGSASFKTQVRTHSPAEPHTWTRAEQRQLVVRLEIVVDTDPDVFYLKCQRTKDFR